MPNKVGHQRITSLILGASALPLCTISASYIDEYVVFMAGIAITLRPELGPDMDVNARRFGFFGEMVGMNAYARLVPHRFGMRRGDWRRFRPEAIFLMSHLPLIGTAFRVMMLMIPIVIFFMITGIDLAELFRYALCLWLGMSISDAGHVIADKLTGDLKELRKEFWDKRMHFNRKAR